MSGEQRYGEPLGGAETAALAVALKAMLLRELQDHGGASIRITEAELLAARRVTFRTDATPEVMIFELVAGDPPDRPRFAAEGY